MNKRKTEFIPENTCPECKGIHFGTYNCPFPSTNITEKPRPTIMELEAILKSEEDTPVEILPNGEIRNIGSGPSTKKPLTMRENLGGEYAVSC